MANVFVVGEQLAARLAEFAVGLNAAAARKGEALREKAARVFADDADRPGA